MDLNTTEIFSEIKKWSKEIDVIISRVHENYLKFPLEADKMMNFDAMVSDFIDINSNTLKIFEKLYNEKINIKVQLHPQLSFYFYY